MVAIGIGLGLGLARGQGGSTDPWTPSEMDAKTVRRYLATKISLADGSAVPSWPDDGPANIPATQATSTRRGIFRATGRNGKPSVQLDGSDDLFSIGTGLPSGNSDQWALVVGYAGASGSYTAIYWGMEGVARSFNLGTNGGNIFASTYGAGNDYSTGVQWATQDRIVLWRLNGASRVGGVRINGSPDLTYTFASVNTDATAGALGGRANNSNYFQGHIQAAIAGSALPTDDEAQRLEGWAAWEFNLVSLLPADHPYKNEAPRK